MVNWKKLEIIWDEWNKNHILKHGVDKSEVEHALKGAIYVKRSSNVYLAIGESSGRILFIVLAERGGNKVYPITARDADGKMKNLYKKRIRT
ncbi:MAG: BrnT family toxin [Euryarchaeota archaeon]|nr:BrnT family toxin [Euryarchaeota archaeon]